VADRSLATGGYAAVLPELNEPQQRFESGRGRKSDAGFQLFAKAGMPNKKQTSWKQRNSDQPSAFNRTHQVGSGGKRH